MTPEAWLRGPVEGVIPELQPVAHSLIQAREDLERIVRERIVSRLSIEEVFDRAMDHLRAVADTEMDDERLVGRGELPSNVRGLLYHMGEHATRHVGQLITTLNVSGEPLPSGPTKVPPDED